MKFPMTASRPNNLIIFALKLGQAFNKNPKFSEYPDFFKLTKTQTFSKFCK